MCFRDEFFSGWEITGGSKKLTVISKKSYPLHHLWVLMWQNLRHHTKSDRSLQIKIECGMYWSRWQQQRQIRNQVSVQDASITRWSTETRVTLGINVYKLILSATEHLSNRRKKHRKNKTARLKTLWKEALAIEMCLQDLLNIHTLNIEKVEIVWPFIESKVIWSLNINWSLGSLLSQMEVFREQETWTLVARPKITKFYRGKRVVKR